MHLMGARPGQACTQGAARPVLVGRGSFADHYHVPSGSMESTLQVGDRRAVDKSAYGLRIPLTHVWLTEKAPQRGDVVVFDSSADGNVLVKSLVGLPGDRIAFDGVKLILLPGERIDEPELPRRQLEGACNCLRCERLSRVSGMLRVQLADLFRVEVTQPQGLQLDVESTKGRGHARAHVERFASNNPSLLSRVSGGGRSWTGSAMSARRCISRRTAC
jgi:signal peptidase I